jgi:hypothetical protein
MLSCYHVKEFSVDLAVSRIRTGLKYGIKYNFIAANAAVSVYLCYHLNTPRQQQA